jgi:hypothetical protein
MVLLRRATGPTAGGQSGTDNQQLTEERMLGQLRQRPPSEETTTAQGNETLSALEARNLFAQMRHELHMFTQSQGNVDDIADKGWLLDEWVTGTPITGTGTFTTPLPLQFDRPVMIQAILAFGHPQCDQVILSITGGDSPRIIPIQGQGTAAAKAGLPLTSMVFSQIGLLLLPNMVMSITSILSVQPTLATPVGNFLEIMGGALRNEQWRRM